MSKTKVSDSEVVLQGQEKQTRLDDILKRIKGTHVEFTKTETQFDTLGKQMITLCIEVGKLLIEGKTLVVSGQWVKWCEENLPFTKKTEENYRNIVEWLNKESKHITIMEECKNLSELYDRSGIVPKPKKVKTPKVKTPKVNNFPLVETTKTQVKELVTVFKDHKSESDFMTMLKPLVDLYNEYIKNNSVVDISTTPEQSVGVEKMVRHS
jgi:hypothetical protein